MLSSMNACRRFWASDGPTGSWPVRSRFDEKRPTRKVEELHQIAATRTERRQHVQVTSRMRLLSHVNWWLSGKRQSRSDGGWSPTVERLKAMLRITY